MKITIEGWIHARPTYDATAIEYKFWRWDQMDGDTMICPHTIEVEIDSPPDPIALAVAELQRQKDEAGKVFAEKVAEINNRIANLQAISNNPAEEQL